MTQSFSSSTCWPHCTAIIAQQMWMAVGHPADDKRCGDSSGSLHFSPSFSSSQVLPGRKRCQWQCGSSCSSSVNWTFFLTVFLHFSEVNQPMRDTVVGTRLWLWGKCILGKLPRFACCWIGSPRLKCLCCAKPLSNTQTGQVKRSCSIFWLYFSSLILYLTSPASFCELCLYGCWGTCSLLCSAFCLCFLPLLEEAAIPTGGSGRPGVLSSQYLSLLVTLGYWRLQLPLSAKVCWARACEVSEVICEQLCLRDREVV